MGGFIWRQTGTRSLRLFHASMQQLTNHLHNCTKKYDQLINFHYAELHSSFRYLLQNTETRPLSYFQPCYALFCFVFSHPAHFQQVLLSGTRSPRVQLTCSARLEEQSTSAVCTIFRTTIWSTGTRSRKENFSSWGTWILTLDIPRMDWGWR